MRKKDNNFIEHIILGIDPGTNIMGYGVLKIYEGKKMQVIDFDSIRFPRSDNQLLKLKKIFESTAQLVKKYSPDALAIESPFFGKNIQSTLKLGRAQGIAMAACLVHDIPIYEYSPKKIKLAVTGNGNSSKEQVAGGLKHLLKVSIKNIDLDASDALAVAVCHHFQGNLPASDSKSYSGWDSFLKQNPNRIKI